MAAAAAAEPVNGTFEKTIDLSRYLKEKPSNDNKIVIKFDKSSESTTNIFTEETLKNVELEKKIKTYLEENNNKIRDIIKQSLLSSFQITFLEKILSEFGLNNDVCKYLKIVSDTKGQPNIENSMGKTKTQILNLQNRTVSTKPRKHNNDNDNAEFTDLHFIDNKYKNTLESFNEDGKTIKNCIQSEKIFIGYLSLYRKKSAKIVQFGCNHVNSIIIDFKKKYIIIFEPKGNSPTPHIGRIRPDKIKQLLKTKLSNPEDIKIIDALQYFSTRSESMFGYIQTKCPQGSCFDTDCQTYSLYGNLLYLINRNSIKKDGDLKKLFSTDYMNTDYVNLLLMVVLDLACKETPSTIPGLDSICNPLSVGNGQLVPNNNNFNFNNNVNNGNCDVKSKGKDKCNGKGNKNGGGGKKSNKKKNYTLKKKSNKKKNYTLKKKSN